MQSVSCCFMDSIARARVEVFEVSLIFLEILGFICEKHYSGALDRRTGRSTFPSLFTFWNSACSSFCGLGKEVTGT